jgi:hypothetical protein
MAIETALSTQLKWEKFPLLAAHTLARKQLVIEAALGLSPNTLEAYGRAREDFLAFCNAHEVEPVLANKESRILPRGRAWGYAPSFPGSFAATTPAFFLSLSR